MVNYREHLLLREEVNNSVDEVADESKQVDTT